MIDQRGVGDHQTSACALPVSTVRHLGLEHTIEETHPDCSVWVRERPHGFPLPEPFCTITYRAFCEALFERSGAAFEQAASRGARAPTSCSPAAAGRRVASSSTPPAGGARSTPPARSTPTRPA